MRSMVILHYVVWWEVCCIYLLYLKSSMDKPQKELFWAMGILLHQDFFNKNKWVCANLLIMKITCLHIIKSRPISYYPLFSSFELCFSCRLCQNAINHTMSIIKKFHQRDLVSLILYNDPPVYWVAIKFVMNFKIMK